MDTKEKLYDTLMNNKYFLFGTQGEEVYEMVEFMFYYGFDKLTNKVNKWKGECETRLWHCGRIRLIFKTELTQFDNRDIWDNRLTVGTVQEVSGLLEQYKNVIHNTDKHLLLEQYVTNYSAAIDNHYRQAVRNWQIERILN